MTAGFFPYGAALPILEGKMMAIWEGIRVASELGFQHLEVEANSRTTINLVNGEALSLKPICSMLSDIEVAKLDFQIITSVSFVKRQANGLAHILAKYGLGFLSDLIWMEESLIFLWDAILTYCFSYQWKAPISFKKEKKKRL